MSSKNIRVLAIVALVFMGIFTVSFILFLLDPEMWNGVVAFITLFSGVFGIGLFFLVKMFKKKQEEKENELNVPEGDSDEDANDDENLSQNDATAKTQGSGEVASESDAEPDVQGQQKSDSDV